jgi:hypothetical protein
MALFSKAELLRVQVFETGAFKKSAEGQTFDIFLAHSYDDGNLIKQLKQAVEGMGYSAYVDWINDQELDRSKVTKENAALLRKRLQQCKCLFFVTSVNSPKSIWMPWELGYFDAFKNRVAILPLTEQPTGSDSYVEQEYLGLYPYVTKGRSDKDNKDTLWIHETASKYVIFRQWIEGKELVEHPVR